MSLTQMQVFNQYVQPAVIETLAEMMKVFNSASGGAITLTNDKFGGDFLQKAFYASLNSAQRRVDRYSANAPVAPVNLSQIKHSSVKVAGAFGPVIYEPSQMTWLTKPEAEGIEVISKSLAENILKDQLNTVIAALVAAIENQPTATNDVSATAGVSYTALNSAHAKFGDASSDIVASIINGATYHKFIEKNIGNVGNLFSSASVTIVNILGKPVIVTDAPALYKSGAPNKMKMLGLTAGAAQVFGGADLIANIQTANGNDRITTSLQGDYSFGVSLKGYSWDEANGGKSPSDAAIATGSNWDKVATSIKHTAGVVAIVDADK